MRQLCLPSWSAALCPFSASLLLITKEYTEVSNHLSRFNMLRMCIRQRVMLGRRAEIRHRSISKYWFRCHFLYGLSDA